MTAGHPAALSSRKIVVDNVRGDAEKLRAVIISDESGQGRYDDLYNRCIAEAVEVKAGDFLFCALRTAWACSCKGDDEPHCDQRVQTANRRA